MNQSAEIRQVGMLILRQPDIAAAVAFYQRLGLRLKFQLQDKWAEMLVGGIKIGLCPASAPQDYRTGIVLQVDDLNVFYATHKDTVPFIGEPKEAIHGIMVSFKDPGGNILDLYQPTPERVAQLVKKVASEGDPISDDCCLKKEKVDENKPSRQCCRSANPEAVS